MCLFHKYGSWKEQSKVGHQFSMVKKCTKCGFIKYKFITEPCSFSNYKPEYTRTRTEEQSGKFYSKYSISKGNCLICNKEDFNSVPIN